MKINKSSKNLANVNSKDLTLKCSLNSNVKTFAPDTGIFIYNVRSHFIAAATAVANEVVGLLMVLLS